MNCFDLCQTSVLNYLALETIWFIISASTCLHVLNIQDFLRQSKGIKLTLREFYAFLFLFRIEFDHNIFGFSCKLFQIFLLSFMVRIWSYMVKIHSLIVEVKPRPTLELSYFFKLQQFSHVLLHRRCTNDFFSIFYETRRMYLKKCTLHIASRHNDFIMKKLFCLFCNIKFKATQEVLKNLCLRVQIPFYSLGKID